MVMFRSPEEHAANPPETWHAFKAGTKAWYLLAGNGVVLDYSTRTKRACEALIERGHVRSLYDREARWYAGEPVSGWKPYQVR